MVTDGMVSVIGTANMDYRSFELNFEVNALVYDVEIARQMKEIFYSDMKDCEKIDPIKWEQRKVHKKLLEKTARLVSPLL
jgi:cardiolipin synthase